MKLTYLKRTGHERYRRPKKENNYVSVARRIRARERLEDQLRRGTKIVKGGSEEVLLEEKDRKRIEREIEILKSRII